jgi:hypothetical protein
MIIKIKKCDIGDAYPQAGHYQNYISENRTTIHLFIKHSMALIADLNLPWGEQYEL